MSRVYLLIALLFASYAPVNANAEALSFSEAETLLGSTRAVQAQQADIDAWSAQQQALQSLNIPQLSLTVAGIAYKKHLALELPILPQPTELDIYRRGIRSQVNMLWPLYTGGRNDAAEKQSAARVSEAEAEYSLLQLQLTKRLFDLYFSNQMMEQVVRVREQAEQTLAQHVHKAVRYEEEGLITSLNRMQANVSHAEARREAIQSKRQLTDIQAALQSFLQIPELSCLSTPLPRPTALHQESSWFVAQAKEHNPVFIQLMAKDQQVKQQLRMEHGKRLPEVFMVGSYDLNRSATPLTEPDWSIGLGVRYHFTTSVNRSSSMDAARSRQRQLEYHQAQAAADIELAVESSYRAVMQYLEQFELLEQDLALAREHARMQRHGFEEGIATSLDVTDARLKQTASEIESLQAAFQYISALAELAQYTGQPELLSQWLPTLLQEQQCSPP